MHIDKKTGIVVPLGALRTNENEPIGNYLCLKPLADFCEKANLQVIQLLPVNDTGTSSSPYSGLSAFALHPIYLNFESLPEFNEVFENDRTFNSSYKAYKKQFKAKNRFNYTEVLQKKVELLHYMFNYLEKQIIQEDKIKASLKMNVIDPNKEETKASLFQKELNNFVKNNHWVIQYAVFKNLKDSSMQASWKEWNSDFQNLSREQIMTRWNNKALKSSHNFFVWEQLRCHEQFKEASDYIRSKGIILKGDIPILMNEDSVDCWSFKEFFNQELRAGSPPDDSNPTGQNWGFPIYNWERLQADEYTWWKNRVKSASQYYDAFRIDHILGFFRIWTVNQNNDSAYLGFPTPYSPITKKELEDLGFDKDRIKWLSKPHIPTGLIEDITWNHDEATEVLETIGERVNNEELWTFNESLVGNKNLLEYKFFEDDAKDFRVKKALMEKWNDRALLELEENNFVPVYVYKNSTAWQTLNNEEQEKLIHLFEEKQGEQDVLWKNHALQTLTAICRASDMIPCAEDLGVSLSVMSEVLQKLDILSLKVVRWNRIWDRQDQPFVDFEDYPQMSVCTTSVHDSSTLRQWWNEEKQSVEMFINLCEKDFEESSFNAKDESVIQMELFNSEDLDSLNKNKETLKNSAFTPEIAEFVLNQVAKSNSNWLILPLQDYLYLDHSYYLGDSESERINIPGTVTDFNWTYRIPTSIENLNKNKSIINKIKTVVDIHNMEEK